MSQSGSLSSLPAMSGGRGGGGMGGGRLPTTLPTLDSSPSLARLPPPGVRPQQSPPPAPGVGRGLPAVLPTMKLKKKKKKKKKKDGGDLDSSFDDSSMDSTSVDSSLDRPAGGLLQHLDPPPMRPIQKQPDLAPAPMHHLFMNARDPGPLNNAFGEGSSHVFKSTMRGPAAMPPQKSGAPKRSVKAAEHSTRAGTAEKNSEKKREKKSERREDRAEDVYDQLEDMGYRRIRQVYYKEGYMFYSCKSEREENLQSMLVCAKCSEELFMVTKDAKEELYDHLVTHKRLKVRCPCGHKCGMGPEIKKHQQECEVYIQRVMKKHTKSIAKAIAIAQQMAEKI